jgi:hypothetical protein
MRSPDPVANLRRFRCPNRAGYSDQFIIGQNSVGPLRIGGAQEAACALNRKRNGYARSLQSKFNVPSKSRVIASASSAQTGLRRMRFNDSQLPGVFKKILLPAGGNQPKSASTTYSISFEIRMVHCENRRQPLTFRQMDESRIRKIHRAIPIALHQAR